MRHLVLSLSLIPAAAMAQCPFDPTIEPASLILCPDEQMELSTQAYDAYQWYKDGSAIPGATGPAHTVDYISDGGSEFSVETTLGGCTEMSPAVLVDGWVFLLPYVMHGGDEPYEMGGNGESYFCEGDLLTLTLGMPYTENITWYRDGQVIDGENGTTLEITTSGSYTCTAAPGICPNTIMSLGVDVVVLFLAPQQPVIIVDDGGQLCASPEGNSYQWYLDGMPLDTGMPCITADGPGTYTVFVDYGSDCQALSDPFIIMGINERRTGLLSLAPNPAHDRLVISREGRPVTSGGWTILDTGGRVVLSGSFNGSAGIDIRSLANGLHALRFVEEGTTMSFMKQ